MIKHWFWWTLKPEMYLNVAGVVSDVLCPPMWSQARTGSGSDTESQTSSGGQCQWWPPVTADLHRYITIQRCLLHKMIINLLTSFFQSQESVWVKTQIEFFFCFLNTLRLNSFFAFWIPPIFMVGLLHFQSRKRLYNHKCLFVRSFVHLSAKPLNSFKSSSSIIHPSSFIFLHSSFIIIHHSSFILPSFRDF